MTRSGGNHTHSSNTVGDDKASEREKQTLAGQVQRDSQVTITLRPAEGIQFFQDKLQVSRALESRYQNLIPCAAPVIIDPVSYNGYYYHTVYQPHYDLINMKGAKTKYQSQRKDRQLLYMPPSQFLNTQ